MARPDLFARIDDRLIHGQVVVGCCEPLDAHLIIVVHDEMAGDAFQQRIYSAAVPPDIAVEFLAVEEAAGRIRDLDPEDTRTVIVLTADCASMNRLVKSGAGLRRVCVGGMHYRDGGVEVWPGFFLDAADRAALREIAGQGVEVVVQSVPGNEAVPALPALDRLEGGS